MKEVKGKLNDEESFQGTSRTDKALLKEVLEVEEVNEEMVF